MIDALDRLGSDGFTRAALWTLERNALGRSFYERSGWVADGDRRDESIGPDTFTEIRYTRSAGA